MSSEPQPQEPPKLPLVYIGPSNPKLGLARLHHYKVLNPHVQAAIKKWPALNLLFVPLDQFSTRAAAVYAGKDNSVNHAVQHLVKAGVF
jgi:hypothetical protein